MKLYDLQIEYCPELRNHPELVAQKPRSIGADSGVYRFKGTNIYSWYVNSRPAVWEPYGELIVLRPQEIMKFRGQLHKDLKRVAKSKAAI